jgi:hypothetical protein
MLNLTSVLLADYIFCCRTRQAVKGRENYRQREKQILDDILGKGYDKRIRPSGKNYTGTSTILRMRQRGEKQSLDDILGKGYDKRIRPSGKN